MNTNSIYETPESDITQSDIDESYQPRIFALKGRIGRLRYLSYNLAYTISFIFLTFLSDWLTTGNTIVGGVFALVLLVPYLCFTISAQCRRLNDLNRSGWWALLLIVPFVNIIFWLYLTFAPGTKINNKFGPRPYPTPKALVILAIIGVFVYISGVLAAIAIPAYQEYIERAQQSNITN